MIRVYLDTCCLNRPFDDQSQLRVRLESDAVIVILERIARGDWALIGSGAVDDELAQVRDPERRSRIQESLQFATEHIALIPIVERRGVHLRTLGFHDYDALHVACAEAATADVLLTTDDAFVRRARRLQQGLKVVVANPLTWLNGLRE